MKYILPGMIVAAMAAFVTAEARLPLVVDLQTQSDVVVSSGFGHTGTGRSVACGDWDGDGVDDLAIGVPSASTLGRDRNGAVYVFLGRGQSPQTLNLQQADYVVHGADESGESSELYRRPETGSALGFADFNGDGNLDLMVGAPGESVTGLNGAPDVGSIHILYGPPTTYDHDLNVVSGLRVEVRGAHSLGYFGSDFDAGYINDDQYADVIGTVPGALHEDGYGFAFLVYGSAAPTNPMTPFANADMSPFFLDEVDPGGISTTVGDYDNDGLDDFVFGLPRTSTLHANQGHVYVVHGEPFKFGPAILNVPAMGSTYTVSEVVGTVLGSGFGTACATGDVDGDGIDDLVVSEPHLGAEHSGVHIVFGGNLNGAVASAVEPEYVAASIYSWLEDVSLGERINMIRVGDVDSDGHDDLLIGSPSTYLAGSSTGSAHVAYGQNRQYYASKDAVDINRQGASILESDGVGSVGRSVAIGDFNGDGIGDVFVSDPSADLGEGRVYVRFGEATAPGDPDPSLSITPVVVVAPPIGDPGDEMATTVQVNSANGPVAGATVELRFSTQAQTLLGWCDGVPLQSVTGVTDMNGMVRLHAYAGGSLAPFVWPNVGHSGHPAVAVAPWPATIHVDGELFGRSWIVSPDISDASGHLVHETDWQGGVLEVSIGDAIAFTPFIANEWFDYGRDLNGDGRVTLSDAILLTGYINNYASCSTGGS